MNKRKPNHFHETEKYICCTFVIFDDVISDEIHSLCYLSSKDECGLTFYLQNPTPVSFQGSLCI